MDTYHPLDWTLLPVGNSGAFPLPHVVAPNPPRAWWTLPQLNTPYAQQRAIAPVMEPTRYVDGVITYGVMQGYHSSGQYRGWFAESGEVPARVIGPVIEHFPPGNVDTWPDDIKPQFRVPSHTGVHYHDEAWFGSGSGTNTWAGVRVSEGHVDADGEGDAQWSGDGGVRQAQWAASGRGEASFYSDTGETPAVPWVPGYYDQPRRQRQKVVVRASIDATLPGLESEIEAHAVARSVLRAAMDSTLPHLRGWGDAHVSSAATTDTPLPVLDAALAAAARNRAAMRGVPAAASGAAQARTLARAAMQPTVAVSGEIAASVRTAGRSDATLPAAESRTAATGKPLPPVDLDAELLLLAALALDEEDEEDEIG